MMSPLRFFLLCRFWRSNYQCAGLISRLYGDDLVCGVLFGSRAGVHEIMTSTGPQLIWTGDRWYSADDALKGHDYQFWTALKWGPPDPGSEFPEAPTLLPLDNSTRFSLTLPPATHWRAGVSGKGGDLKL